MHIFAWSPNAYAPKNRRRHMVTPVHRFQRIESIFNDPRMRFDGVRGRYVRGNRWNGCPRLPRQREQPGTTPAPTTNPPPPRESEENSQSSSNPSRPSLPENFNRFRMGSINWGLWACFIVVTALLVPAHIYLKQYAYRGELMGIFFVITLLFLVCFSVSMFHSKTRTILLHRLHLEEEMSNCPENSNETNSSNITNIHRQFSNNLNANHQRLLGVNGYNVRTSRSTPELLLTGETSIDMENLNRNGGARGLLNIASTALRTTEANVPLGEPPPPYEIAILLPSPLQEEQQRPCETPPPAYNSIQ